jgi:hypothetical protein
VTFTILVDCIGQTRESPFVHDEADAWKSFEIDLASPAAKHFGGDNAGAIRYPITDVLRWNIQDHAGTW